MMYTDLCACVSLTLSVCDAVWRYRTADMDDPTAVGHLVLTRVFTHVIIINRVNDAQIEQQTIQHLENEQTHAHTELRI